ncbi:MAG: RIP metalloprotease RseP [Thermomicrobiales bacterium]|nr:RIP metalloprotease RseP [Thermomicrobiales bacterium]
MLGVPSQNHPIARSPNLERVTAPPVEPSIAPCRGAVYTRHNSNFASAGIPVDARRVGPFRCCLRPAGVSAGSPAELCLVSDGLLNGLYIIPILAVLILVHEFGHFFAARWVGAKVEEFGIGIPPRLKGWEHNGVIWSINWIPFGGFVRVLGEDGKNMDPGSMNAKGPAQRAFFLAAGSAMNFLLAIVLMIAVVGFQGIASSNVYIGSVSPNSPAAAAGWQTGDRIIEVAGAPIDGSAEVGQRARDFAGQPLSVVIQRDGADIETKVTPRANPPAGEGPTGVGITEAILSNIYVTAVAPGSPSAAAGLEPGDRILSIGGQPATDRFIFAAGLTGAEGRALPIVVDRDGQQAALTLAVPQAAADADADMMAVIGLDAKLKPIFEKVPPAEVIPRGIGEAWGQITQMMGGLRDIVTGQTSLGQIAGPIGMGQITSEVIEASPLPLWVTLAQISILLSLNLAILNLLPLPALDGGRLLFVLIEVLRGGKRIPPEREGVVHLAGMIILIGVMFLVAFLDVGRIVGGSSFLP